MPSKKRKPRSATKARRLRLSLLGPFQAYLNDKELDRLRSPKQIALLAYLASQPKRRCSRSKLTGMLWPEVTEEKARQSLRQALYSLRRLLHDNTDHAPLLIVDRQSVGLVQSPQLSLDITTHQRAMTAEATLVEVGHGLALYRGDFLAQLTLEDSEPFEEWLLRQRERYQQQTLQRLFWLGEQLVAQSPPQLERALQYAWKQLELSPWREEAHRQVMALLYQQNQRSAALEQYEICRRVLDQELGVEPNLETENLYEEISNDRHTTTPTSLISLTPPEAERLYWLALNEQNRSNIKRAAAYAQQGLALSRQLKQAHLIAQSLRQLGIFSWSTGEYEESARYLLESLSLYRTLGHSRGISATLNQLGNVFRGNARHEEARHYYRSSLVLAQRTNDPRTLSACLNNLGVLSRVEQEHELAISYFSQSLEHCRRMGAKRLEAIVLHNLGDIYFRLKQDKLAEAHTSHSLNIRREIGATRGIADELRYLAKIARVRGQFDKATAYLHESITIAHTHKLTFVLMFGLCECAALIASTGHYERALRLLSSIQQHPDYRPIRSPHEYYVEQRRQWEQEISPTLWEQIRRHNKHKDAHSLLQRMLHTPNTLAEFQA